MNDLHALALANRYGADISPLYVTFSTQRFIEMMQLHGTTPRDAAELEAFKAYLQDPAPSSQAKYDAHYTDDEPKTGV